MTHILIFDSGVGGLSVVGDIRRLLLNDRQLHMHMSYVADDMFRPYGEKTETQLQARLPELLWILVEAVRPDVLIVACNTASTTALTEIRAALDIPVIGVVPAIKPACEMSRTGTIAVLGTPGTVRRRYVDGLIADFASDCHVILQGSVGLVNIAERKLAGEVVDLDQIRREISPLFQGSHGADIDVVVLACTHFPLLKAELEAATIRPVIWIDSGPAIARRLEAILTGLPVNQAQKPYEKQGQEGALAADEAFDIALLVGSECSPERRKAFVEYGFRRVVTLNG